MKLRNIIPVLVIVAFGIPICLGAQEVSNTGIAKSLGLYVFPQNNQDSTTQSNDEAACYTWAKNESGVDPINPPKAEAAPVDTSPDGSMVSGAARGAAAGLAVGAITGDAGEGAAVGAVLGGLAGRRAKNANDHYQRRANEAAANAYNADQLNNFAKAFSACMTAKGYVVK